MTRRRILLAGAAMAALAGARRGVAGTMATGPVSHSEAEWRRLLTPQQFEILREAGTEAPNSSRLAHETRPGRYDCIGCASPLFPSRTKFDSGTGWPSFWQPYDGRVTTKADDSYGMTRIAVSCAQCDGHLGHVFDDGPKPTGLRYCMNGAVLSFHPDA